jgi:hypothetical protein
MIDRIGTIHEFASVNVDAFIEGEKTVFKGIGADVLLRKLHGRAKLVTSPDPRPYLTTALALPHSEIEVFFDVKPIRCATFAICMACWSAVVATIVTSWPRKQVFSA